MLSKMVMLGILIIFGSWFVGMIIFTWWYDNKVIRNKKHTHEERKQKYEERARKLNDKEPWWLCPYTHTPCTKGCGQWRHAAVINPWYGRDYELALLLPGCERFHLVIEEDEER